MAYNVNQDLTNLSLQEQDYNIENGQFEHNQQSISDPSDFQKYLEPNTQLLQQNFGYMDPNELPGQQYVGGDDELNLHQSLLRDQFGEGELIQIENNQQENVGNNAAYQRSRPDGSPMFSQSSGFVPGDSESVVFRPIKQLDFSSLDETGLTDVILPRGMNRSASTPDNKNSRSISMISREQYIENTGTDHNESPDGNFYELKSSPNQSEPEEELDSKVIFSPLHGGNKFQGDNFDPGMKSPPLSKMQNLRQNIPQKINFENQQNDHTEHFELSQRPINDTDISSFRNDVSISPLMNEPLTQNQHFVKTSPQRSAQSFGRDGRSPKYSPSHGQSPHHHSISPSLRHSQAVETREIFVSVPQHVQFGYSPDSLNQSGGENQKLMNLGINESHPVNRSNVNPRSQQQYVTTMALSGQQKQNPSNMSEYETTQNTARQPGTNEGRGQQSFNQPGIKSQISANNPKIEVKPADKKPWNYAKGSGNHDTQSYLEKGAHKREIMAQHAKVRMSREEPKGKVQERSNVQPMKAKRDLRPGNGQSTENINKVGEMAGKSTRQPIQGQNKVSSVPVPRSSQPAETDNRYGSNSMSRGNRSEVVKQAGTARNGREQHKTKEDYSPVTQVEQYSEAYESNLDVQEMEDVRSQLKNMLKLSTGESMIEGKPYDFNEGSEYVQSNQYPGNIDFSLMSGTGQDNVSDLMENFPSITACMWTDNSSINRNDVSVHNENTRLREMLEKERYRRKHCEQQIQKLNIKHLETQQQLAVAVSTDKRKDIMIEQLDKQLGKVLEGWKNQDQEKTVSLEKIRQEKMRLENVISKKQQVIDSFEKDMAQALDVVRQERDEAETMAEQFRSRIEENERNKQHAEEMLVTEREKCSLMKQELDMVKDNRDQADKKFQQLQDRMYQEQDSWFKREQELLNKIDEVSEANVKVLQQEKDKNEEMSNRNKKMEDEIHEIQKHIKKMEMEYDAMQREKESLKVEMGIMEAKFESSQRTLEAELASQMEKEIADQMSELQKRVEKADSELREKHYEHTKELNMRHKEDLEKHLANFHRQLKDKDDENRRQVQEYEEKLQQYRSEISHLQETKQKLEKQRTDILLKLQQMMQSQWNEALSLLATTPQRKRGNFNGPSKQGGSESKTSSKMELNLHLNNPETEGSTLHMSDLATRENLSSSQRGNNSDTTRNEIPMSTEVNMADFQASLHMQQLLQSLSSITTQPFPAYGHGPPIPQQDPYHDSHQTVPFTHRSGSSHEESRPASYPSSPNAKHGQHHVNRPAYQQEPHIQDNYENRPTYQHESHRAQVYHENHPTYQHEPHTTQDNVSLPFGANYTQQPLNYQISDETDEFNNHLQMLLNMNRPNPASKPVPQNDSVNYGQDSNAQRHLPKSRQPNRQASHESVDQWLRQSLPSHDSNIQGQSHDLNRSHVSHAGSQPEDLKSHMGMAVPIRPPQQQESFVSHPDSEVLPVSSSRHPDTSLHPTSVCYSPPTKQTRTQALQQDPDPLLNESVRLTKDYNDISDKVEEHEYRQGELQHYIQMLLQKPPGSVVDPDEMASLFSHDQTEDLDMNDTAQARQIEKELSRIQELREKPPGQDETDRKAVTFANAQGSRAVGQSFQGVLQPEHLAEISRYLEKHKDQMSGKAQEDEHISEIVGLLRHMQKQNPPKPGENRVPVSPKSPKDKARKNLKVQLSKVADSPQPRQEPAQGQSVKSQGQPKKERKVASVGPNRHIQGKGKNAWK